MQGPTGKAPPEAQAATSLEGSCSGRSWGRCACKGLPVSTCSRGWRIWKKHVLQTCSAQKVSA